MLQLYRVSQNQYSIFENLKSFYQHSWHLGVLFDSKENSEGYYRIDASQDVLPCHPLVYPLVSYLQDENLRYLNKEIKRISFKEIRNPKLETNSDLHDRREEFARTKKGLIETAIYIPAEVKKYFATHPKGTTSSRIRTGIASFRKLQSSKVFPMETFQLFMSSLAYRTVDQARRGGQLTFLALIYVPLLFVTGIFGMNIQQINGSGLRSGSVLLRLYLYSL